MKKGHSVIKKDFPLSSSLLAVVSLSTMVDPFLLNAYFWYAILGVYSLFFLYIIMVIIAQKTYYPYVYLYVIISCALLTSILNVVSDPLDMYFSTPLHSAASVYSNLTVSLTWLFVYEPSRQINNLRCAVYDFHTQSTSASDGRVSPWKLSQYTSTGVGIIILVGYFLAFLLVLLNIVLIIMLYLDSFGTTGSIGLPYFVIYAPWLYALMWLFLAASHWRDMEHKASYLAYGALAFCIQIAITLVKTPGVFSGYGSVYPSLIVDFVLIRLTHFAAIFVGIIYGSRWVPPNNYDAVTNPK